MAQQEQFNFWQSYSDIAMGVMAVFALIMILLLVKEKDESKIHRQEAEKLRLERKTLELEREKMALELIRMLRVTEGYRKLGKDVEEWVRGLFTESACELRLDDNFQLVRVDKKGRRVAQLYRPGSTLLDEASLRALLSCKLQFELMAICLSPGRQSDCLKKLRSAKMDDTKKLVNHFRDNLRSLVLQGNTDREPYRHPKKVPKLYTVKARRLYFKLPKLKRRRRGKRRKKRRENLPLAFVTNGYLGAERARQALANLLSLVQYQPGDPSSPLEVLLRRIRVESPSFGLYQAGPLKARMGACVPKQPRCKQARNLRLLLRWKPTMIEKPYRKFRTLLCNQLKNPESTIAKGLKNTKEKRKELIAQFCPKEKKDVAGSPKARNPPNVRPRKAPPGDR